VFHCRTSELLKRRRASDHTPPTVEHCTPAYDFQNHSRRSTTMAHDVHQTGDMV